VFQELVSHPGRMVHAVQLRARRPDGEYFWLEVSACNRLDDPAVKGIVVNWRNITERKEAEEALRELYANLERRVQERTAELTAANARLNLEVAERRRAQDRIEQLQADLAHAGRLNTVGEMASGLAHELNQPLTAIATYAAAALLRLREHCDTGWTPAEALTRIGEQATRAGDVIQRLRAFVSRKPPQRLPVALDEVLHEALQLADADIRASGTRLELHASDLPLHCTADRIQIVQVLVNLVRNALEAMADIPKAARQLVLRTALEKNGIRLSVADTGSGLAPEIAERLFFPFHTSKPDGLGLGLAISRSIVEAHDGRIWAEPNRGGGTVFHFTLPAARDGAPRSHVADAEALR
ncbi:MAG TPA: ATP-binding protein, partial [Gemmataceae bacterium]|nr:ATP-binding protein [Gemmataceae bacterium]